MALEPNGLAQAMQSALPGAWVTVKGEPFPGDPNDPDQRVMFLAIARGVLKYLESNQKGVISTIQLSTGGNPPVSFTANALDLNITGV